MVHADRSRPLRRLELAEQVGEPRVAVGVLGEVRAQAVEELLLAHPGDELADRRGALRVGDAVEVHLDRLEVDHVGGDRVRRGQLVLAVGPVLALAAGTSSRRRRSGWRGRCVVRGPLGEGLVEPQVVPPRHRDEVAEPHVRELVQHRVGALLVRRVGDARAEDVVLAGSSRSRRSPSRPALNSGTNSWSYLPNGYGVPKDSSKNSKPCLVTVNRSSGSRCSARLARQKRPSG